MQRIRTRKALQSSSQFTLIFSGDDPCVLDVICPRLVLKQSQFRFRKLAGDVFASITITITVALRMELDVVEGDFEEFPHVVEAVDNCGSKVLAHFLLVPYPRPFPK